MSELKPLPCPFCGSENIAVGSDKGTVYRHNTAFGDLTRSVPTVRWAYCVDCGCVAPAEKVNNFDGFYKPDEQEDALNRAISTWNRRAQPANEPLTRDCVEEAPAADVAPVVHAHWKHDESNDRAYDYCSACGCGTMRRTYGYNPDGREYMTEQSYSYCPRCGARMDAKEDKQ